MSLKFTIKGSGADIQQIERRMKDLRPAMLKVGGVFSKELDRNLNAGRSYKSGNLSPVAEWTRWATGKPASKPPLNVTGKFRRNHRITSISSKKVVFGPTTGYQQRASLMYYGGKSSMKVDPSKVFKSRSGAEYIRIEGSDGQTYVRKVKNGRIDITVTPRPYFGLTNRQADDALKKVADYLMGVN